MIQLDTIGGALSWAADQLSQTSSTARLDAELLLAHVLGWSRAGVIAERQHALSAEQQAVFRGLVARRVALEPVAYLVGHKQFYGLDFEVGPAVLVPRPETELLVDLGLSFARQVGAGSRTLLAADIGTGSGCIAIALAVHWPEALVTAVDISLEALLVAERNILRHNLSARVRLVQGDLLAPLDSPVDLILSNPPYTVLEEIAPGVRLHEPRLALDGGPDGLAPYQRLLAQAPAKLRPGGAVMLEIGATQGQAVAAIAARHFPKADISVHKDLADLDRVVTIHAVAC